MARDQTVPLQRTQHFIAALLGTCAMAAAISPSRTVQLTLLAIPCLIGFSYWVILRCTRWLEVFFIALLLLPPLAVPWGDSGIHLSPLIVCLGLLASVIGITDWRPLSHPLTTTFSVFLFVLLESTYLAAVYSGWQIALGSLARVLLFAISGFVYLYTFAGPAGNSPSALRTAKLLYWIAVAAAAFACLDFYFQFTAPARFSEQFIYLDQSALRRAQGLFYEASTLGNFCAFFLVMIAAAFLRSGRPSVSSRSGLIFGGIVLAGALMLSYSRASVINIVVALSVMFVLRFEKPQRSFRMMAGVTILVVAGIAAVHLALPALSTNYWGRLLGSFSFFSESPDRILSGRIGHWQALLGFLAREPWHAFLGIGYKTLPYSTFAGSTMIADNTYLSLLAETGVVGLIAFICLNVAILRTGWKAMRSPRPDAAFLGQWIFCFWCGQIVQMFSCDLITYWRVWPVYTWVLAAAARQTEDNR